MKRLPLSLSLTLALTLLLAAAAPAHAWLVQKAGSAVTPTTFLIYGHAAGNIANTATRYLALGYTYSPNASAGDLIVMPFAGSLTGLNADIRTAPTGSQTWTVTVVKNGSDTSTSCVINSSSSPAGTCSSSTSTSFSAGDVLAVKYTPANSPTTARGSVSAVFEPTNPNDTLVVSYATAAPSNSTQQAMHAWAGTGWGTLAARRQTPMPEAGTLDKLYIKAASAPGSGTQFDFSLGKNGATTALVCTLANTATTCNDTSNSFTVSAGDDLQYISTPTNTPTGAVTGFGSRFVPNTSGTYPIMHAGITANHATETRYYALVGSNSGAVSATESDVQVISHTQDICKMQVKLSTAPGSGKSRAYTLRKNGSDTALTCTVSGTNTTCSADLGGSCVSVSNNDLLSTSDVPSSSPATSTPAIGYSAKR